MLQYDPKKKIIHVLARQHVFETSHNSPLELPENRNQPLLQGKKNAYKRVIKQEVITYTKS